jgi:hypothetical protein
MVLLERVQRFLAAVAVDPSPDDAEVEVYEDLDPELHRRIRHAAWNPTTLPGVMVELGYRPGPLVLEAAEAMGSPGDHGLHASATGPRGYEFRWKWRRQRPFDPDPLIEMYRRHEADPPVRSAPNKRGLGLRLSHQFEVKCPGATGPLFPGAELRSAATISLDARRGGVALRYDSPEMTVALRQAHADILAALGPKTPPHALHRIIPATRPDGRERRETIV